MYLERSRYVADGRCSSAFGRTSRNNAQFMVPQTTLRDSIVSLQMRVFRNTHAGLRDNKHPEVRGNTLHEASR